MRNAPALPVRADTAPPTAKADRERHRADPRAAQSRCSQRRASRHGGEAERGRDQASRAWRRPRYLDRGRARRPRRREVGSPGTASAASAPQRSQLVGDLRMAVRAAQDVLLDRRRHQRGRLHRRPTRAGSASACQRRCRAHAIPPRARAQLRLGAVQPRLDGALGTPSSRPASRVVRPSRTVACITARSSGESRPCGAGVAVLHAGERAVLEGSRGGDGARRVAQQHDVAPRPQPAHEAPDRDAPHPGADLAGAAISLGALPDGDEGVLQDVGHDLAVVAAPHQPDREPRGVPVVELPQGADVSSGQGLEEDLVVGNDRRSHISTVDLRRPNGSRFASVASNGDLRPAARRPLRDVAVHAGKAGPGPAVDAWWAGQSSSSTGGFVPK